MTAFGFSEKHLNSLQKALASFPEIKRAYIYGSRAMGTHQTFSDIDLALEGDDITEKTLLNLAEIIDNLLLPYEVDLSSIAGIKNPKLLAHIERVGQMIYSSIS